MKTYKWKVAAFVAWVVVTIIVVSVALRGVSKADTATNLISVAILLFGAPDKPCGVGRADANPKLLLNDT